MHSITSQEEKGRVELGPTLMSKVQLQGCAIDALLDTGSPASIISLEGPLESLAKQREPNESPQQWRTGMEKCLQAPPGALLCSLVCQVTVSLERGNHDITAKVYVQKDLQSNWYCSTIHRYTASSPTL